MTRQNGLPRCAGLAWALRDSNPRPLPSDVELEDELESPDPGFVAGEPVVDALAGHVEPVGDFGYFQPSCTTAMTA